MFCARAQEIMPPAKKPMSPGACALYPIARRFENCGLGFRGLEMPKGRHEHSAWFYRLHRLEMNISPIGKKVAHLVPV
jgi:hypothetical protein